MTGIVSRPWGTSTDKAAIVFDIRLLGRRSAEKSKSVVRVSLMPDSPSLTSCTVRLRWLTGKWVRFASDSGSTSGLSTSKTPATIYDKGVLSGRNSGLVQSLLEKGGEKDEELQDYRHRLFPGSLAIWIESAPSTRQDGYCWNNLCALSSSRYGGARNRNYASCFLTCGLR